jgi:hypothetical protein
MSEMGKKEVHEQQGTGTGHTGGNPKAGEHAPAKKEDGKGGNAGTGHALTGKTGGHKKARKGKVGSVKEMLAYRKKKHGF